MGTAGSRTPAIDILTTDHGRSDLKVWCLPNGLALNVTVAGTPEFYICNMMVASS